MLYGNLHGMIPKSKIQIRRDAVLNILTKLSTVFATCLLDDILQLVILPQDLHLAMQVNPELIPRVELSETQMPTHIGQLYSTSCHFQ